MNLHTSLEAREAKLVGRRRSERTKCEIVVEVKDGASEWVRVLLADYSATGFRLTYVPEEFAGTSLWLRLPGLGPLAGKVCWRRDRAVGCELLSTRDWQTEELVRRLLPDGGMPGC